MEALRALRAENRRLASEVVELRARVRAFERSRWWKLHPGVGWRRLADRIGTSRDAPPPHETAPDPPFVPATALTADAFRREVVARGTFTEDWFTSNIAHLEGVLAPLEGREARILEIGSYEGLSTCFFLWRLQDARVTAVDLFDRGADDELQHSGTSRKLEGTFDGNVELVDASRTTKIVGDSREVLLRLLRDEAQFDLVYVDGSHLGLDVLVDACLSWQLLADDAVLVFDDYRWSDLGDDSLLRPGPAIDAFLTLVAGKHKVLGRDHQLSLRRTA